MLIEPWNAQQSRFVKMMQRNNSMAVQIEN